MRKPEKRGQNTWRIGVQKNEPGRPWVRKTLKFPPDMDEQTQFLKAQVEQAKLELSLYAGEDDKINYITVADFITMWDEKHLLLNVEPTTREGYLSLAQKHIIPHIGKQFVQELTPLILTDWINAVKNTNKADTSIPPEKRKRKPTEAEIRQYYKKKAQKLSPRSVRSIYDTMRTALKMAQDWDIIEKNPIEKVQRPKVKKNKPVPLTEEQAYDILQLVMRYDENPSFQCAVFLGVLCGLRLGEVGALTFYDVSWNDATIDISKALHYTASTGSYTADPKTDSGIRKIALPETIMKLLEVVYYNQVQMKDTIGSRWRGEYHILAKWDGSSYHHDTPSKWWREFADTHGYEDVTFHDLRHTHTSLLFVNNLDVVSISHQAGHSSPDTTLRNYAHFLKKVDRRPAEIMDNLFESIHEK